MTLRISLKILKIYKIHTIFKIFYQNECENQKNDENDEETTPFDKVYNEFKKFKNLLIKHGTDLITKDSQKNIIKKFKELYKEDKTIQNELSSLISGEPQKEEEVTIMLNAKNFEKDLNSMFEFFSYFKNNENLKK